MKGYTLIEILLVIAIVLAVGFLSLAFPTRMLRQAQVSDTAEQLRGALNKARTYALSGKADSAWGVHYGNSTITFFKGENYAGRDQALDEETAFNENVSLSGFSEVVFEQPDGRPNRTLSEIKIYRDNAEETFSLNSEGVLE